MLKLDLLKISKVSSVYYFKISDCIALETSGFNLVVNPAAGRDYYRLSYRGIYLNDVGSRPEDGGKEFKPLPSLNLKQNPT